MQGKNWFHKNRYHSHAYISSIWMLPSIILWVDKSPIIKGMSCINKHMHMSIHVVSPDFLRTPLIAQGYDGLLFEFESLTCDRACFCIKNWSFEYQILYKEVISYDLNVSLYWSKNPMSHSFFCRIAAKMKIILNMALLEWCNIISVVF